MEVATLMGRANDHGVVDSAPNNELFEKKRKKRKRKELVDVDSEGCEEQVVGKRERLTEEERVWQYVCKRSVFISPPRPVQRPDIEKPFKALIPASHWNVQRFPPLFNQEPGRSPAQFNEGLVKTSKTEVTVNDVTINVTLTRESSVAQEWIEKQSGSHFGLDLEWQPNRRKGQKENKVALLQISTETECLLVQMLFLDSIPTALVKFLKDPERKLTGVGIRGDAEKLQRDYGLVCQGEVELTTLAMAKLRNNDLKRAGLKVLAKVVLGLDMEKSKNVTMSNWSDSQLHRRQVEYACKDAWVSLAIFQRLQA